MMKRILVLAMIMMLPFARADAGGESVMLDGNATTVEFGDLGPGTLSFTQAERTPDAPTAEITDALVREVERGAQYCSQMPRIEYSLDCLSDRMAFTARLVPRIREYAELRATLTIAAQETRKLVRQNRSRNLPTGSVRLGDTRTRALVPIDPEKRELVVARTEEIVRAARNRMWQVAAQSVEVRGHYEAFAEAIGAYDLLLVAALPARG